MEISRDRIVKRLRDELSYYSENCLRIKPKVGDFIPFVFNRAQEYLHFRLEEQKRKTGKVRAIILKGRQQGCSTYVGARFFHQTSTCFSTLTFIFAHDAEASDSLFTMVKNYYELLPLDVKPTQGATNKKELLFPRLKSGYRVGTAGTRGLGRSKTFQNVHWSEVAYSPHSDEHASGILETVADKPNTEIILESTANGQGNYFHRMAKEALSGTSDYQLVFIPWYWQEEYARPLEDDFTLTDEEILLLDLYESDGLTKEHLNWRRYKIAGYQDGVYSFMREYPFNPEEAFSVSDEESYIKAAEFIECRKTPRVVCGKAPLVIGVDPAAEGKDRIAVVHRRGRDIEKIYRLPKMDPTALSSRLAEIINKYKPHKMFIDVGGLGLGVYSNLASMGEAFKKIVKKVNFGGDADDKDLYVNKRCEMYGRAKEWLNDKPCSISEQDERAVDALQADITSVQLHKNRDLRQRLKLESKLDMKARGIPSPDMGDAFVLTFAFILPATELDESLKRMGMSGETVTADIDFNPFDGF